MTQGKVVWWVTAVDGAATHTEGGVCFGEGGVVTTGGVVGDVDSCCMQRAYEVLPEIPLLATLTVQ